MSDTTQKSTQDVATKSADNQTVVTTTTAADTTQQQDVDKAHYEFFQF